MNQEYIGHCDAGAKYLFYFGVDFIFILGLSI
jgi:hypothetical protein